MKKLISIGILFFSFALISAQTTGQVKKQVTPQKKGQVKTQATPQKKDQVKTQVTPKIKVQNKTQVATQNKGQIVNAATPCQWQKNESDPFTGVAAKTTNWELVGYNTSMNATINNEITGDYRFSISENIQKKDTSFMLWIRTSTSQNLSFNKDSKILIKSGETILTVNLIGGTLSGRSLTSNGILDSDSRKFLKKHSIDLIRIQCSGDGNTVINVDLKDVDKYTKLESDYFIKTLRCFE
jgi:hypothetical protein